MKYVVATFYADGNEHAKDEDAKILSIYVNDLHNYELDSQYEDLIDNSTEDLDEGCNTKSKLKESIKRKLRRKLMERKRIESQFGKKLRNRKFSK